MLVDQSFLDVFSVKYYYIVILLFFIVYQIFIMIFLDKKSIFIMVIVCYNVVMMLTLLFVINETINIFDGKNDKINIYNKEYVLLRSFDNGYLAYDNDFKYIYFITRSNNIIIKYDFPKDFKPELNILNEEAWINIDKNMEKILKDSLSVIPSIR